MFWILMLVLFFATNILDKAESVKLKLDEKPDKIIDEIFGEGWWNNEKAEEWHKLTLDHNFHHEIDRQNTQIGQIEPNSTDQLEQIEPNSTDQLGQIEPNSSDQNHPLTESDHSHNAKNGEEQNEIIIEITSHENIAEDERKRKIVDKFHAMKDEFRQKGKYSVKEWNQIDNRIAKHLKINRKKIYKWKKEFGLTQRKPENERKNLIEKFDQKKAELERAGFKNSYRHKIDETVAKELGITDRTISRWKRKLGQTASKHKHHHSEQKELIKSYYEIKNQNPKIRDEDIAKMLKIGTVTLYKWKKQFKRKQLHPKL